MPKNEKGSVNAKRLLKQKDKALKGAALGAAKHAVRIQGLKKWIKGLEREAKIRGDKEEAHGPLPLANLLGNKNESRKTRIKARKRKKKLIIKYGAKKVKSAEDKVFRLGLKKERQEKKAK